MPKYNQYSNAPTTKKEKQKIHPVWRGIGCVMIVVIPVFAFFIADFLVKSHESLRWVLIPQSLIASKLPNPLIWVTIFYTVIIALILFLTMGVITFVIDRFFGPPKRGPYDVK